MWLGDTQSPSSMSVRGESDQLVKFGDLTLVRYITKKSRDTLLWQLWVEVGLRYRFYSDGKEKNLNLIKMKRE